MSEAVSFQSKRRELRDTTPVCSYNLFEYIWVLKRRRTGSRIAYVNLAIDRTSTDSRIKNKIKKTPFNKTFRFNIQNLVRSDKSSGVFYVIRSRYTPYTHQGRSRICVYPIKKARIRNNIVLGQTFHKFIHKFTQSVMQSHLFLIIPPYFCWRLLLSLKWTNKGDYETNYTLQCFCKPVPEAAAANRWQER